MMWIMLACASPKGDDKFMYDDSDSGSAYQDTAYYGADSTDTADYPASEDAAWMEDVRWWKLSVELTIQAGEIEPVVTKELYSDTMGFLCSQRLVVDSLSTMESPFGGAERWFSIDFERSDSENCPYVYSESELQFGIGPLISDLAVARDLVEWSSASDSTLFAETTPQGAYVLDSNQNTAIAYGLSYSAVTEGDIERISLRPIYSFAW